VRCESTVRGEYTVQNDLLDRVRKLLAKAEDEACTQEEAEALTRKAAELMARYGIDRALLGAARPETDRPADRLVDLPRPWSAVKGHLLAGLAGALRCQCVLVTRSTGRVAHVFGYASDLERADILFTSLLVQMARALAAQDVAAASGGEAKAWRRSWMLGYCSAVVARVRAAEEAAVAAATSGADGAGGGAGEGAGGGRSAALVLADRSLTVRLQVQAAYPHIRRMKVTYTGRGYADGYRQGQQADIGGAKLRSRSAGALGR
jgi:hypothetical protein